MGSRRDIPISGSAISKMHKTACVNTQQNSTVVLPRDAFHDETMHESEIKRRYWRKTCLKGMKIGAQIYSIGISKRSSNRRGRRGKLKHH